MWPENANAGLRDDALLHGRRDERLCRARDAQLRRAAQHVEHVRRVARRRACPPPPARAARSATPAGCRRACGPTCADASRTSRSATRSPSARARISKQRRVAEHGEPRRESRASRAPARCRGRCRPARRSSRRSRAGRSRSDSGIAAAHRGRAAARTAATAARYRRMSTNAWSRKRRSPQLALFFGFARANLRARTARVSLRRWCRASGAPSTSTRCQPKRVLIGSLSSFERQLRERLLELRHGVARRDPAQVAAFGRRRGVFRHGLGDRREVVAAQDLRCECRAASAARRASSRISFGRSRMWRTCSWSTIVRSAPRMSFELHDLEAAAALDRAREYSPGFIRITTIGEQRRQLRALAPAQAAALERRLRVRRRDREAREVLAGFEPVVDLFDPRARPPRCPAAWRWPARRSRCARCCSRTRRGVCARAPARHSSSSRGVTAIRAMTSRCSSCSMIRSRRLSSRYVA